MDQKEQLVRLLLDHGVPAKFWPRTLGDPVVVQYVKRDWIRLKIKRSDDTSFVLLLPAHMARHIDVGKTIKVEQ